MISYGGNNITFPDASTQNTSPKTGFVNRIINGGMTIDQRNNGASVTSATTNTFTLDRWVCGLTQASKFSVQQNAGAVTPPTGFKNYAGITSTSSYAVTSSDVFFFEQRVEGFNVADLGFGTAAASTVTVSFMVRSSLTGTFGGCLRNGANTRSYPFTFTIVAANTWEQKTITVAGDTSGTWLSDNGSGLKLTFGLGSGATYAGTAGAWATAEYYSATGATSVVGTSGATFYITGVQLEKGSTATPFEFRSIGTEFALCQRYYEVFGIAPASLYVESNASAGGFALVGNWSFGVEKRANPTMTSSGTFTTLNTTGSLVFLSPSTRNFAAYYLSSGTAGRIFWYNDASSRIIASIEL